MANLLNNAAKYTDRGGRIALTADREGDEAVVRVRDNGIGLSAEMLPRVFDLFAQEDRSLDRSQGGLGIGLTLVRSLVQLHGGSISAESPGPGLGSEFTIRLPASPPVQWTPGRGRGRSPAAASPPRLLRVLVVDDSQDSARSLARVLKLWGHEVRVAHDGPAAIEATQSEAFDVILLDIGLPGMDGYQVAERLRTRFGSPGPFVDRPDRLRTGGRPGPLPRSVGFDDHLVKPVDLDRLRALLADVGLFAGRGGRNESASSVASE